MKTRTKPEIEGKTLRWTFTDGPTKGSAYDHAFHKDGTVAWGDAGKSARGESVPYTAMKVSDDVQVVSYLSKSGYTLTMALNFDDNQMFGFASNDTQWHPVKGTFEDVS